MLCGVEQAAAKAEELGLTVNYAASEGSALMSGDLVMELCGRPQSDSEGGGHVDGHHVQAIGHCGRGRPLRTRGGRDAHSLWFVKKMPFEIKPRIRSAIAAGGASVRICDEPMVYLDKNYVEMLGGIQASLRAAEQLEGRKKVVQIRGKYENGDIVREAFSAVSAGADIVFVDTGRLSDIRKVCEALLPALRSWKEEFGYRDVKLAYAGRRQI